MQYRQATESLIDELKVEADLLQEHFKEAVIPVQIVTTENRADVAIIFERVNRKGVPLETLDLLVAWTWSDQFDLHQKFTDLAEEIEPFGFKDLGDDTNLLLRCCSAVVAGDPSPGTLVSLNGAAIRERFEDVVNGVKGAIDFLRRNLRVYTLDNLPYLTLLVPLTAFFAASGSKQVSLSNAQRRALLRWFWKSCFSKRYSGGVLRNLKTDITAMNELRNGDTDQLGSFNATVSTDFFTENNFRIDAVNSKTFILMLAQKIPLSFVSGSPVDLDKVLTESNRNEFHHIFPRAHLFTLDPSIEHSRLVNFCFMSRSDNNLLGGVAPSKYRAKMPDDIADVLEHAFCPETMFDDNYDAFVSARAEMLTQEAQRLMR